MVPHGHAPGSAGPVTTGPVTLVVVNARVWTGIPRRPWADAVVARGDRLAFVGSGAEARKLATHAPDARVVDARGALLVALADEGALGPLAAGNDASFVLLDRDLPYVTPDTVRSAHVALAVRAGRVVAPADL